MTAGDDNDEGAFVKQPYVLHSINFQNVCLCMSMYMLELSVKLYILYEGTNRIISCIIDFYIFENFDLLSQAPVV